MRKTLRVGMLVILGVLIPCLLVLSTYFNASARTVTEVYSAIMDKAVFQGVYKCYTNGYIEPSVDPLSNYVGIESLVKSRDSSENYVPLVTGVKGATLFAHSRFAVSDNGLSCGQLFKGGSYVLGGSNDGLLAVTNHRAPSRDSTSEVVSFMENMGYAVTQNSSDVCYGMRFTRVTEYFGNVNGVTNSVCQGSDGKLYLHRDADSDENVKFGVSNSGRKVCLYLPSSAGGNPDEKACDTLSTGSILDASFIRSIVYNSCNQANLVYDTGTGIRIEFDGDISGDNGTMQDSLRGYSAKFINNSSKDAALTAVRFLSGSSEYTSDSALAVGGLEERLLYQSYLTSYYNVMVDCTEGLSDSMPGKINWFDTSDKTMKVCHYKTDNAKNTSDKVNGIVSGWFSYNSINGLQDLLKKLGDLPTSYSDEEISGAGAIIDSGIEGSSSGSGRNDVCYDGSGNLGWLICPVIKMVSGIGEYMWGVIEENLQIPAEGLFKNTTGVRDAWDAIRNISNILFVILFLFVIFSQLTGIGIDNYGIKRILPKLILVAILINLSYIICELAVDLSNILGMGLNSLLTEQASGIPVPSAMSTGEVVSGWMVDTVIAGGGVTLFLLLNPASAIVAAAGLGLAVLGLLITTIVSIFFMYVTLVVRQAGVILMIVLAPIALACYLLPNTEKLFKKWFDLFKALLIVYPICGALIGAGQLAGAVLASINTPTMRVAAMLVQVVPFFLLPMIIRNSLSLMGNIGGRLSTWGRNLGRRGSNFAQGQIRNSERFKDWQKFQQDRATENRARRTIRSLSGRTLDRRGQERLAKARAIVLEQEKSRRENALNAREDTFNARLAKQNLEADEARYDLDLYGDASFVNAQRTKSQNARAERIAEADVGVVPVNSVLARQRAEARRNAQEFRNFQDQYANFSRTDLETEMNNASTWYNPLNNPSSSQQMSALIKAMEAAGMEKDIYTMLKANNVGNDAGVMAILAGSGNKVLKAYGKKGAGVSFNDFMSQAVSVNGVNYSSRMAQYISEKGSDFIDGLDDKALSEIMSHNNGDALSTEMLVQAAARINSQDAVDKIDEMLVSRPDIQISGAQLTGLNVSTVNKLNGTAVGQNALLRASDDIARSPELINRLSAQNKITINALRTGSGRSVI